MPLLNGYIIWWILSSKILYGLRSIPTSNNNASCLSCGDEIDAERSAMVAFVRIPFSRLNDLKCGTRYLHINFYPSTQLEQLVFFARVLDCLSFSGRLPPLFFLSVELLIIIGSVMLFPANGSLENQNGHRPFLFCPREIWIPTTYLKKLKEKGTKVSFSSVHVLLSSVLSLIRQMHPIEIAQENLVSKCVGFFTYYYNKWTRNT